MMSDLKEKGKKRKKNQISDMLKMNKGLER